jgi:signal transduction histidine kinase
MSHDDVVEPTLDLQSLLTVATATVDVAGSLVEANGEFLRLAGPSTAVGTTIVHHFIQPSFHYLVTSFPGQSGQIYDGLLTIVDDHEVTRTLHARIWRDSQRLWLVAEHDVVGMERLNSTVIELNRDYALAQLEVVQSKIKLSQLNAELERRVEERTRALNEALKRAEAADRAKNAFLNTTGHELRTPLNSVIGFSQVLLDEASGELNSEQRKQVSTIQRSGKQLLDLVQDILDRSSSEAGNLVRLGPVSLQAAIEEQRESFRDLAHEWNLQLPPAQCDESIIVLADPPGLSRVIRKLIANAIKFTDQGRIQVRAAVVDGMARVDVEDSGIGIPAHRQPELFAPVARAGNPKVGTIAGAGTGLLACKRVIEAMGGAIGVDSEPGRGSRFWFTLPLAPHADASSGG